MVLLLRLVLVRNIRLYSRLKVYKNIFLIIPLRLNFIFINLFQLAGLGVIDFDRVAKSVQSSSVTKKRLNKYKEYSNNERFSMGKHASLYGVASAVKKWKARHPYINESTIRGFRKRYEVQIKTAALQKISPKKSLINKRRGRPRLLGDKLDDLVQRFLKATRYKGGIVNTTVAIATATALVNRYPLLEKDNILLSRAWAQSLFRRMGFTKRRATTGKIKIPPGAQEEAELKFMHQLVNQIEKYNIPPSLIINFDQTPSKYVPVAPTTMAKKGSSTVPISGVHDKRSITATFAITLSGIFLPMQLIYSGKTNQSLPKIEFPKTFSLSVNEKHYSNEHESLKLLSEIIIPYIEKERENLGLPETQKALLIFDVFRGQTTQRFTEYLDSSNICVTKVPPNMTHLYQPLDLTVNKFAKDFMKKKFSEWFTRQMDLALENGQELEDVDIDYRLSVLKPLHGKWMIDLFDHMSTEAGKIVVINGWKRAGIYDSVSMGSNGLPSLDPFNDLNPLLPECRSFSENTSLSSLFPIELECFKNKPVADEEDETESGSEWEEDDGNAFDAFNEEYPS